MEFEGGSYLENDPKPEALRHLNELNRLLAKLIETGAELDPLHRQQIRYRVQLLLGNLLGSFGMERVGAEGLLEIRQRLHLEYRPERFPSPPQYPSKSDFQRNLLQVFYGENENLPTPRAGNPRASEVARYGRYPWSTVEGRGGRYTLDYLYDLGKVMVTPVAYDGLFQYDKIAVHSNWNIFNGVHRSLVLRTLGPSFVEESGMNQWVLVDLLNP